jgi:hypothetical protein
VVKCHRDLCGRVFSISGVVLAGASEAPVSRLQGARGAMIPSPPDAVKNFSVESSIMAHYRVDAPTAG